MRSLALFLVFMLSSAVVFSDSFEDKITINGFYTLDLSYAVDGDRTQGTSSGENFVYEKGKLTLDSSVIGLQFDWQINEALSLTAQGVSTRQTNDDLDPELEWAYLSYDFGLDSSLKIGQRKVPFYRGAELRYIGVSRLWARSIVPDSGAGGFDNYTGLELSTSYHFDDFNLSFQGVYGEPEHGLQVTQGNQLALLSTQIDNEFGWLKFVLLHAEFDVFTPKSNLLIEKNAEAVMAGIELEYNIKHWVISAGASYEDIEINPDGRWLYLSIGYQLGSFTPFVFAQDSRLSFTPFDVPLPPPPLGPPPPGPPPAPPQAPDGEINAQTYALGFRYDMTPTSAIKMQVERWNQTRHQRSWLPAEKDQSTLFTLTYEGVF